MSLSNVEIAETYLNAIGTRDPTRALLAPTATLQYPLSPHTVTGAASVREYMSSFLPSIDKVEIERHITDGDYVATLWQAYTVWGVIPICSVFRVGDGLIQEVRAFFDPRLITPLR